METKQGRRFILRDGFLEQIVNGAKMPEGYIGAYGLKLPPDVHQFRGLDGQMYPLKKLDLADCVYMPLK